jgi:hypothetical protein
MRHLISTYIQADAATELDALGEMSLTELIIKTGIHDAIAKKLNEKGNPHTELHSIRFVLGSLLDWKVLLMANCLDSDLLDAHVKQALIDCLVQKASDYLNAHVY